MSASYSNVSFVLHGRFYVNDTLILTNCSVYAYPAAQIIVLTGGALILQGTTITACTQMWKGIMLNDKSRLVMTEQSLVADADIGIQAMNGSSFFLLGSSVTDCVRSIFVPQQSNGLNNVQGYVNDCRFGLYATAFKPDYTGQPPHHAMPRAGMEFNDVVMTIGDYQYNEFRNCNWGIYAVRSMLKVQKGRFYNMNKGGSLYGSAAHKGSAIVAESKTAGKAGKIQVADCQIDTCEHGIYTEWTTADINNVNALHVTGNGSYHLYCNSANMSTYVAACNLEAGKAGIVFQNSEQATMTAKNNTIKVTTGGSSTGIKIIATNSNAGNYVLKGNVIEAANGNGITVNFAKNATIVDNMIKLSGNTTSGISLTGCDSSTVSCNTVSGRYPAVSYQNKGINAVLMQFLNNNANTTFGKLNNVKQLMKEASSLDFSNTMLLSAKDILLNIHLSNIQILDSIAATDSTINNLQSRENDIAEINTLKQDISNIIFSDNTNKAAKLHEATTWNNAVQPNEIPEYNLKQVNDINIIYQRENSKDSIAQYYGTLLNIAEQCPQSGGIAVYNARSLVAFFNNTIFYDDDNVCLQQGYYRLSNELKNNKILKESALIPNPASKYADVVLNKTFEGICRIKITDIYSKMIFEKSFDCSKNYYRINTSGFLNGMYYVQIIINDNAQNVVKLIIVK
jgi:hypothetical protein